MNFPKGYKIALINDSELANKWPNLQLGINSEITSLKDLPGNAYNCVAFALGEENSIADMLIYSKWVDLSACGLDNANLTHTAEAYASLFNHFYHFERCLSADREAGYTKIALFEGYDEDDELNFLHVAIQLENGKWKSKLGNYEDIEHDSLEVLSGKLYGHPSIFMKRLDSLDIKILSAEND
jgi:hypothetical protein